VSRLDDIKLIAESLGYELREVQLEEGRPYFTAMFRNGQLSRSSLFDPFKDWSACGLVLEALVKECNQMKVILSLAPEVHIYKYLMSGAMKTLYVSDEFNKESICMAYLNIIGGSDER